MRYTALSIPALIAGFALGAFAQAPAKVGVINIQAAIAATKDGQKAQAELGTKFAPLRGRLEKKNAEIEADKAALNRGSNAMSAEQKEKLMRDIDQKTKALNRDAEDAQAEVDQETQKIMQELGGRMMVILNKYAKDNGYALIMDVPPQTPVLYAPDDLTETIIKLYDQNSPNPASGAAAPKTPAAAAPPPSTPAAAPKTPAAASPAKKAPAAK